MFIFLTFLSQKQNGISIKNKMVILVRGSFSFGVLLQRLIFILSNYVTIRDRYDKKLFNLIQTTFNLLKELCNVNVKL